MFLTQMGFELQPQGETPTLRNTALNEMSAHDACAPMSPAGRNILSKNCRRGFHVPSIGSATGCHLPSRRRPRVVP
jgi:hypothetical protein